MPSHPESFPSIHARSLLLAGVLGLVATFAACADLAPETDFARQGLPLTSNDEVVLYAQDFTRVGTHWSLVDDPGAVAGKALSNAGGVFSAVSATPASHAQATFQADAGRTYYVWIRGRAASPGNFNSDAFWVQFDQSLTPAGVATVRMGTTGAAAYNGYAGLTGFNWLGGDATNDNEDVAPLAVRFAASGTQTLRIQSRQATVFIDEVWLSTTRSTRPSPQNAVRLKDPVATDLQWSRFASRTSPQPLAGSTLSGDAYVFAAERPAVTKVDFYLDGTLHQTEATAPYDFEGGTVTAARPFDTGAVATGAHTVQARYTFTDGGTLDTEASFTVVRAPPDGGTTPVLTTQGNQFRLDGAPFDMWGIRVASASQTQVNTDHLLAQLDDYLEHGVNTVTVFYAGSSGGNSNPFTNQGLTVDPANHARMVQILEATAARNMVVVVGLFYQNAPFGLQSQTEVENAVRTVTRLLRPYRHVIINIANEQNSSGWSGEAAVYDFRVPANIIHLCEVVHDEDPERLVGGGGYDHDRNEAIGVSSEVDVLLFDTSSFSEDSRALHDRFVAAGVTNKPLVNVEIFGAVTATTVPGVYSSSQKSPHLLEIQRTLDRPGLSVFFHSNSWCQGTPNHYDLLGQGTSTDPGIHWYFDAVQAARGL
ncbi:hypothetical protein [Corallococcus sp. M7]